MKTGLFCSTPGDIMYDCNNCLGNLRVQCGTEIDLPYDKIIHSKVIRNHRDIPSLSALFSSRMER